MVNLLGQLPGVVTSAKVTVNVPAQLSVATTAETLPTGTSEAQETVTLAGIEVITGAVWSSTVMVCVWVDAFPHTSVTV
jgi:hypothetical protein